MIIEQLYTKCLAEAAYYIESNGEVAIIDPMRETDQYIKMATNNGAKIKYVFERLKPTMIPLLHKITKSLKSAM